jgi:hypothetical protein
MKPAVVAKYFYSSREGELQTSHRSMLQSILYDILDQSDSFFYSGFQSEYRKALRKRHRVDWQYESLQRILLSLKNHSSREQLYLIIDALDEADDEDRRHILNLLFELCSKTTHCVMKVFIASRPHEVLQRYGSRFANIIKLQEHTLSDIREFTRSFMRELQFGKHIETATDYVVGNADGVFIWVELIGRQLKDYDSQGRPPGDILAFLKTLPRGLVKVYRLMLEKLLTDRASILDCIKMFRFVLFAGRPLTVGELQHALRVPDDPVYEFMPSEAFLEKEIPEERYLTHCAGNFLEFKGPKGTTGPGLLSWNFSSDEFAGSRSVQVIHQTVRDFFLRDNGYVSNTVFWICPKDAHRCISITCIRYLMLCATDIARRLPSIDLWTSEDFSHCARCLNEWPLATYALGYLKHHIDGCPEDPGVDHITPEFFEFIKASGYSSVIYLLEKWASSSLNRILLSREHGVAAKDFRNKVFRAAVGMGLPGA